MANVAALRNILDYAEGLGLPEGEYLQVANALRDAFNTRPEAVHRPRYRYVMNRKVKLSFLSRGYPITVILVRQTRTDSGPTGPDMIECEYRVNPRGDGTDDLHIVRTPFRNVINSILWLHKPRSVTIDSDMGKTVVTYAQARRDNLKQVEELKRRIASPGLDGGMVAYLEERLTEEVDFNYTDFTAEVARRVPDVESFYRL